MPVEARTGKRFAVVAGHPLAADAAAQLLQDGGGNVVDAAIAGAAVLTIALPHACSLGGDCFALVHVGGQTYGVNGSGRSPTKLPVDASPQQLAGGPLSCSVPGVLGGWQELHRRFGRLPWRMLFPRAIELAQQGVPVASELAGAMRRLREPLMRDPGCRALFLQDGQPWQYGERLVQPALASTFDTLAAEGARALYEGDIGATLCRGIQAAGGVLDREDLAEYRPDWVAPLEYVYRGHAVRVMPPNSWGVFMLMQLAALDGVAFGDRPRGSSDRFDPLIRAARASFSIGSRFVADPRDVADALPKALSASTVQALRTAMAVGVASASAVQQSQGTAVISVADSEGNGITIVQSVFMPFGSLVADSSTGIVMNNRLLGFTNDPSHPNRAAPAKRPAHTLNPVMVLNHGKLHWLMGTPGGSGQTLTLVQVLSNLLDYGMDLTAAVAEPRWSMDLEGQLLLEPEIGADVADALAARGLNTRIAAEQRTFFGSAECIEYVQDGLSAVADHRRNAGVAVG